MAKKKKKRQETRWELVGGPLCGRTVSCSYTHMFYRWTDLDGKVYIYKRIADPLGNAFVVYMYREPCKKRTGK